ncbi:MAG: hypothetical protein KFF49_04290 [Bacteroidales bacterium]|nr:hypothetical protein [Bacteroidales bacterium]
MKLLRYILLVFVLAVHGCSDLQVINENDPDGSRVFSDENAIMDVAGTAFRTYHNCIQDYFSLAGPMAVMADHHTCAWGKWYGYSIEPRELIKEFNNSLNDPYYYQIRGQWQGSYSAITNANIIFRELNDEESELSFTAEQRSLLESFSWFVSGVSHGYLGLVFDKALVVRYDDSPEEFQLEQWDRLIDESLTMLDRAIEIAGQNSFEVPPEWVGGQLMTNIELSQLANAYAARILAYSSRTSSHNSGLDWHRVLDYARNGLDWDFAPQLGKTYDFYDNYWLYGVYPGWGRVDMRVINLMDHDYPSHWPADNVSWNTPDGMDPGPADPDDARLLTDFYYLQNNDFPPSRGYYHFSHYRFKRYDYVREEVWHGNKPRPTFLEWEVKLLEAEALYRTGNISGAVAILNDPSGPRKIRGQLPDVDPATDDVLRLILDEKEIECYTTGAGVPYFDMRRTDRLQPGTWLHFPVPAGELEMLNLPHYTIHTIADGVEGSAGGWTGYDE